jgi:hypothetical protein
VQFVREKQEGKIFVYSVVGKSTESAACSQIQTETARASSECMLDSQNLPQILKISQVTNAARNKRDEGMLLNYLYDS